jgi:quercetin dioxygenase-like cupin family protein
MEIRRFGVGQRRPEGPPRSTGVTGRVIHADARGAIMELAFGRGARLETHSSPNPAWFVVIEGGGWVEVGDETARVAAGEAVLLPAGLDHAARCGLSEMRAIVVELAGPSGGGSAGTEGSVPEREPDGVPRRWERAAAGAASAGPSGRGSASRLGGDRRGATGAEGEPD